jgi:hypothetical protein
MSVILESQPGDEFVCIVEFHGSPDGEPFSWDTSLKFRVGERLRFVSARRHPHLKDQPGGWQVVFDGPDGKRYAATQVYFVTLETWEGIKNYFARELLREPKKTKARPRSKK